MAKHEFGILQDPPQPGKRYDQYDPCEYDREYDCVCVDDAYLEGIVERFAQIDFYWHTLDVPGKGIAYCGITLIPPCSIRAFVEVIKDIPELSALRNLVEKARADDKWIIHYGL